MCTDSVDALGFEWDRAAVRLDVGVHTVERAVWRYHRSLPEFVWDAAVLEGNPFTYPEVQTRIDGITVGGRRLSDEQQIVRLVEAARELITLVKSGEFALGKRTSDHSQELIARNEELEAGHFRGEGTTILTPGVSLGEHGRDMPPETEPGGENLRRIFDTGVQHILTQIVRTGHSIFPVRGTTAILFRWEQANRPDNDERASDVAWARCHQRSRRPAGRVQCRHGRFLSDKRGDGRLLLLGFLPPRL